MTIKTLDLNETAFISSVASDVRDFFVDAVNLDLSERKVSFYTRAPSQREAYSSDVLSTSGQLINAVEQMRFATEMLSGFRSNGNSAMTRYDYIVFQMENHLLRAGMIVDRSLKLVNSVFNLGNPPAQCKFDVVTKNRYVVNSPSAGALKAIRKRMQSTQAERNNVVHSKSYDHDDLYHIGLHSTMLRSGTDATTDWAAQFIKTQADNFVIGRKSELTILNDDVLKLIAALFDSLIPAYNEQLKKMG